MSACALSFGLPIVQLECAASNQINHTLLLRRRGKSRRALPFKRTPPSWLKITPEEVSTLICRAAKKGQTPSQIGVLLRDSHGINSVQGVTGAKILRILKLNGNHYLVLRGSLLLTIARCRNGT